MYKSAFSVFNKCVMWVYVRETMEKNFHVCVCAICWRNKVNEYWISSRFGVPVSHVLYIYVYLINIGLKLSNTREQSHRALLTFFSLINFWLPYSMNLYISFFFSLSISMWVYTVIVVVLCHILPTFHVSLCLSVCVLQLSSIPRIHI